MARDVMTMGERVMLRKKPSPVIRGPQGASASRPASLWTTEHFGFASSSLVQMQNPSDATGMAHGARNLSHDFADVRVLAPVSEKIRPKLTVSQPEDEHEREADRLADRVMRMPQADRVPRLDDEPVMPSQGVHQSAGCDCCVSRQVLDGASAEPVAETNALFPPDQLEKDEEEEAALEGQRLMPKTLSPGGPVKSAPPSVPELLARSPAGTAVPSHVRAFMEPRFGRNFGDVRLHADRPAAQLCSILGAKAFTISRDVYFGAGWYQPGTREGLHLMAHELAHVDQQKRATTASINHSVIQRACEWFPKHSDPSTYCENRTEAEARITRACPPYRDDFLYRDGPPTHRWRPIPGYGCAHHVAHILGISVGKSWERCQGGFSVTIGQITQGRTAFPLAEAQVNDIWSTGYHSGVITEVDAAGARVRINQCGTGGTASQYWTTSGQAYR